MFEILNDIGLDILNTNISQEDINSIIDDRNKLFHQGDTINLEILYNKLFPLVSEIVGKLITDPNLLN